MILKFAAQQRSAKIDLVGGRRMENRKRIVVASDSFKGTLSQLDVCRLINDTVASRFPQLEAVCLPIADGGEGSIDCFEYFLGGERVFVDTENHYFEPIRTYFLRIGDTAVIEAAKACGLNLSARRDVLSAGSYGLGRLIRAAIDGGARRIMLCLGGTGSSDGGCGMAHALGVRFFDADGVSFVPNGRTAADIASISLPPSVLGECRLQVLTDTSVPLCGTGGAAYVYAPQKGADKNEVILNDTALSVLAKRLGDGYAELEGGGAAGGIAAMAHFLGGEIVSGIETVLDAFGLDNYLSSSSLALTGEGRLDAQSLTGKAVFGVAKRALAAGVPLAIVAGQVSDELDGRQLSELGVSFLRGCSQAVPKTKKEAEQAYIAAFCAVIEEFLG